VDQRISNIEICIELYLCAYGRRMNTLDVSFWNHRVTNASFSPLSDPLCRPSHLRKKGYSFEATLASSRTRGQSNDTAKRIRHRVSSLRDFRRTATVKVSRDGHSQPRRETTGSLFRNVHGAPARGILEQRKSSDVCILRGETNVLHARLSR